MTRRGASSGRQFPRTARLNRLFREILAEELELIDDDRLDLVTIMDVEVDAELSRARVFYSAHDEPPGTDLVDALAAYRVQLQRAIGQQARVRRVPELVFEPDRTTEAASRIEEILRGLPETEAGSAAAAARGAGDDKGQDKGQAAPGDENDDGKEAE